MIHEAVRMLAAAYDDDTIGVNARLGDMDRDDSDRTTPRLKKVLTPLGADGSGIKLDPPEFGSDFPVLAVLQSAPWVAKAASKGLFLRDGDTLLTSVYVTQEADLWQALLDAYDTARAMLQTLTLWMRETNRAAYRVRNQVEVVGFSQADGSVQIGEVLEYVGNTLIALHVTTALQVKDKQSIS